MLPPADAYDTLEYFLKEDVVESFPLRPDALIDAVFNREAYDRRRILRIAEQATARQTIVARALIEHLVKVAEAPTFLAETRNFPLLRHRGVLLRPELLDSEELPRVEQPQLGSLLALLPKSGELVARIMGRLLALDDGGIASEMSARYPDPTLVAIVRGIQRAADSDTDAVASVWLHCVNDRAEQLIGSGKLLDLASTKGLAKIAEILGHDRSVVLHQGPVPLAKALRFASDNVTGEARQVFLAFLMSVALSKPVSSSELIMELAFDQLHSGLASDTLAPRAKHLLIRHLPDVSWWDRWDYCLRLRIGVVQFYGESGLDESSFSRLTSSQTVRSQLERLWFEGSSRAEMFD